LKIIISIHYTFPYNLNFVILKLDTWVHTRPQQSTATIAVAMSSTASATFITSTQATNGVARGANPLRRLQPDWTFLTSKQRRDFVNTVHTRGSSILTSTNYEWASRPQLSVSGGPLCLIRYLYKIHPYPNIVLIMRPGPLLCNDRGPVRTDNEIRGMYWRGPPPPLYRQRDRSLFRFHV
jgi:hypothetical protein